jgi:putative heme-binding domain-containing protein
LAVALVLRNSGDPAAEKFLPKLLVDADARIRFMAVQWVAEAKLKRFRPQLITGLHSGAAGGEAFAAYLAAVDLLDGGTGAAFEKRQANLIAGLLTQSDLSAGSLVQALRRLPADDKVLTHERFNSLLKHSDANVRIEAVRSLRSSPLEQRGEMLAALAADAEKPTTLRAEAVVALSPANAASRKVLLQLLFDSNVALRREALRSLRGSKLTVPERMRLMAIGRRSQEDADLVARVLDPRRKQNRPAADDIDAWMNRLAGKGDPAAGARIFFHERSGRCFACHRVDGRGGQVGPDLSTAGHYGRRRLIESILQPSREIAPQYVPWTLVKDDGTLLTAVLVSEQGESQLYADAAGKLIRLERKSIVDRKPQTVSIMPNGLAAQLTDQELRDLLAFLGQRR